MLGVGISLYPQTPSAKYGVHIENLMSAAEFRDAGLNKLSPDELKSLDAWLNSYLARLVTRLISPTESSSTPSQTASVIESEIDGEFHGWSGETIFKLTNGQIWQQSEYDYEYEYEYRPKVTIIKTSGGYKMQIEGMSETVAVKRIK